MNCALTFGLEKNGCTDNRPSRPNTPPPGRPHPRLFITIDSNVTYQYHRQHAHETTDSPPPRGERPRHPEMSMHHLPLLVQGFRGSGVEAPPM